MIDKKRMERKNLERGKSEKREARSEIIKIRIGNIF